MPFDYTSLGFYTFDALCRPVRSLPEGASTTLVEEFTIAVSGAAGSASIAAAKHGLSVQAVGGVGEDLMGDWVLRRLQDFYIDVRHMMRCPSYSTSSSIVPTRPDGVRPVFHKRGATAGFFVSDEMMDDVLDTAILHVGGVGLMDRMDTGRTAELMAQAKQRKCCTTLDVFASTSDDLELVKPLLENTDYFMPSGEEAMALSGRTDYTDVIKVFLDLGASAVILTLGEEGLYYQDGKGNQLRLPAYDIDVVCSCGCGDTFNAGFATGLHLGLPIEECLWLGQAAAAQNAMGLGSQAVISNLDSTLHFMRSTKTRPTMC